MGQSLAALKVTLGIARGRQHNEEIIDNAIHMADETIQEMRAVLNSLNPPRLEQGLESALRAMAEGINRIEGVTCRVFAAGDMPAFEDTAALNIYRVVQEACSNAICHANPTLIHVLLRYEQGAITVIVEDDGTGFDVHILDERPRDDNSGFGMSMMKERVYLLSGSIQIDSKIGVGTKIIVKVPISNKEEF